MEIALQEAAGMACVGAARQMMDDLGLHFIRRTSFFSRSLHPGIHGEREAYLAGRGSAWGEEYLGTGELGR